MPALLTEPRWLQAAQALVDGCIDLPHDEDRVALLGAVCDGLGDELYPALLRVLSVIGQHGDHAACEAVARALVHALRTGRLPSGRRSAWGASAPSAAQAAFGRTRSLGPLEYLCAWHTQAEPAQALSAAQFHSAARSVMELISTSREALLPLAIENSVVSRRNFVPPGSVFVNSSSSSGVKGRCEKKPRSAPSMARERSSMWPESDPRKAFNTKKPVSTGWVMPSSVTSMVLV